MGSVRGSHIVPSLGRVTVAPSPQRRTGTIENFSLPHSISEGESINIISLAPILPVVAPLRIVVNGISGQEIAYSVDSITQSIWENGNQKIGIDNQYYRNDGIKLICFEGSVDINSIDVYIDFEKVQLTHN